MQRVQFSRRKGWKMPPDTVYVGRPSPWGNYERDLEAYRRYAAERAARDPDWLKPLINKNLACWCPPGQPCHSEILLDLVNNLT
jgi:hypothetical protein